MTVCPCCGKPKRPKNLDGLGTALKPAAEFAAILRKPLAEPTVAAQVLATGTGALNIDAARVPTDGPTARPPLSTNKHEGYQRPWNRDETARAACEARREEAHDKRDAIGRWPANVAHDGSDEVLEAFARFGFDKGAAAPVRGTEPSSAIKHTFGERARVPGAFHADTGTAARFFYSAKASRADRAGSKHPTVKPIALMRWLCRLVTPPGGVILDPFAGSGTTGQAAREEGFDAILIEREAEYVADIRNRLGRDLFAGAA